MNKKNDKNKNNKNNITLYTLPMWLSFKQIFSAAASNESNSTFDEAMCKKFNDFYDVNPLPEGRVRPKFEGYETHLALVAHSNYTSYKTDYINHVKRDQITPEVQSDFMNLFAQFEQFPTPLAGCLTNTTLKQLKQDNLYEFNKGQLYNKKTDKSQDYKLKFTLVLCKLKFLGFIVEYVTKPVVLEWDTYMKKKQGQGQSLSADDEKQLSTLLQIKLLEGMVDMIEKTKGNATDEYVPTHEEIAHYKVLQVKLQRKRKQLSQQQQPQQPQFQEPQQQPNQQEREKIEEILYSLGGGSKCKRRSKRRRQHKRQKSKKYCK
jgi:hypothetical protein